MKREQKVFAMLMAACMAFAGISMVSTASAAPYHFVQQELGNYLPDEEAEQDPDVIILPSGRKLYLTQEAREAAEKKAAEEKAGQQEADKAAGKKVIKSAKSSAKTTTKEAVRPLTLRR